MKSSQGSVTTNDLTGGTEQERGRERDSFSMMRKDTDKDLYV